MDSSASKNFELTAAVLHIIAMTLMLMDHLWATLLPAREWPHCRKSGISSLSTWRWRVLPLLQFLRAHP